MSKGIGLSISVDKDLMTWKTSSLIPIITTPNSTNASYVGDPHIWKVCAYTSNTYLLGYCMVQLNIINSRIT